MEVTKMTENYLEIDGASMVRDDADYWLHASGSLEENESIFDLDRSSDRYLECMDVIANDFSMNCDGDIEKWQAEHGHIDLINQIEKFLFQ